jgi:hypothetical protein
MRISVLSPGSDENSMDSIVLPQAVVDSTAVDSRVRTRLMANLQLKAPFELKAPFIHPS